MSKIFGGSKQKSYNSSQQSSTSYNKAFPAVQNLYAPMGAYAFNTGIADQDSVLGSSFEDFKSNTGFDFLKELGLKNMMGSFGSRGTIGSGAAAKALQGFGQNLQNTFADRYLSAQNQRASLGLGVGQLLGQTGGYSTSQGTSSGTSSGKSNNGIGSFIGSIIGAAAASERRLKTKIEKIGELEDGLGIYSYEYKTEPGLMYIGTMVEEVEELRPWALGPTTEEGYKTVNYKKLSKGSAE